MTIPTITEYLGVVPDRREQSAEAFTQAAITWTDYQADTFIPSINTTVESMNLAVVAVNDDTALAEDAAATASSSANYQGDWFAGAEVLKGQSWSHNGFLWRAKQDSAVEPTEGAFWLLINAAKTISTKTSESAQDFTDSFALKIFQSPTDGLAKIETRTLLGGEVYEVRKVSDGSLATIYSDKEGLNPITQNGTSNVSGSDGVVKFYIGDGGYRVDVNSASVLFNVGDTVRSIKSNQINSINAEDDELFFVTDKYDGSFWRFKTVSQVVDGQSSTNILFDDERSIQLDNGGYLVFDDDLNAGLISRLESENYAKHIAKIYSRDVTFNINCYGDSITYGQALPDTVGATNKIDDPTNYGDGSLYKHWQYNAAWPVVLQSEINKYVQTDCTVTNRGYSGARAYSGYLMHRNPSASGVSVIAYGTNEVLFSTANGANLEGIRTNSLDGIEGYKQAIKRFAIREILRGNTVILMSTLNFSGSVGWDGRTTSSTKAHKAYDEQLKAVGIELGLKVVNWKESITNSYATNRITQDGVHPNSVGHTVIGAKLTALLMSGHKFTEVVSSGSKLLANSAISNVFQEGAAGVVTLPNATSYTPPFVGSEPQTVNVTSSDPLLFTFYASEDDLIVWPEIVVNNTTATIKLINGYEQSEYLLDGAINKPITFNAAAPAAVTASPSSTKTITESSSVRHGQASEPVYIDGAGFIHIATKGYYTLAIENSGSTGLLVDGLSFLSYEQAKAKHNNPMCTFNGAGSVVEQKYVGISSVTRVDAGRYDIFFSNDAPDEFYGVSAIARASALGSGVRLHVGMPAGDGGNVTDKKCRIEVIDSSTGARTDAESVRVMFDFGVR